MIRSNERNNEIVPYWIKHHIGLLLFLYKELIYTRIMSTDGGILWTVIPQLLQLAVYFFIFSFGLRSSAVNNVPFIIYMIPAYIVWMFISESISSSIPLLKQYNYIISKFPLPYYVLILSQYLYQLTLYIVLSCAFLMVSIWYHHYDFSLRSCSVLIITFASLLIFIYSISLILSICCFVSKDIENLTPVVLNLAFWLSPIVYPDSLLYQIRPIIRNMLVYLIPTNSYILDISLVVQICCYSPPLQLAHRT